MSKFYLVSNGSQLTVCFIAGSILWARTFIPKDVKYILIGIAI